jgi:malate synthase
VATHGSSIAGVEILGSQSAETQQILTSEALTFVVDLGRKFGRGRRELLSASAERQKRLDAGERPDFLPQTAEIRKNTWTVAPLPADLLMEKPSNPVNKRPTQRPRITWMVCVSSLLAE